MCQGRESSQESSIWPYGLEKTEKSILGQKTELTKTPSVPGTQPPLEQFQGQLGPPKHLKPG